MSTRCVVFYHKGKLEWKHVEDVQKELQNAGFKPIYNEEENKRLKTFDFFKDKRDK